MKGDINQANIFRHYRNTQKVIKEETPEWVKKARSGFKPPKGKDIEKIVKSREVPERFRIPARKRSRRR